MVLVRKYFWQILTSLLAIFAIFATYNVFYLGNPKKEIRIVTEPPISLVDVKAEAKPDIQVYYRDALVSNLFLYQFQIQNSGNQPITEKDYYRSLKISFPEEYQIVDIVITESEPDNIGMSINQLSGNEAIVSDTLLNPDDKVSIQVILIGKNNLITEDVLNIDGRISGVKDIKSVSSKEQRIPNWVAVLVGFLTGVILSFVFMKNILPPIELCVSFINKMGWFQKGNKNKGD